MICETKYNFCLDKRFLVPLFTASCRWWYIWRQILSQSALVLQTLINRNVFCSQIYWILVKVDNFSCSEWNLILKCVRLQEGGEWEVTSIGFQRLSLGAESLRNITQRESAVFYHTARLSWPVHRFIEQNEYRTTTKVNYCKEPDLYNNGLTGFQDHCHIFIRNVDASRIKHEFLTDLIQHSSKQRFICFN